MDLPRTQVHSVSREPFAAVRLPLVITPLEGDDLEAGGILNPAAARGPDGQLYLFPRLVAAGNYSRVGIARVHFSPAGEPDGLERLGVAIEPQEPYERNSLTGGGVEDPRVTYVAPFGRYIMTYTAFSPAGPRIALAWSRDLRHWTRLGPVKFGPGRVDFNDVNNKDGVIFPDFIPGPDGMPSLALIHRPLFPGTLPHQVHRQLASEALLAGVNGHGASHHNGNNGQVDSFGRVRSPHESLWISYCSQPHPDGPWVFDQHHRLLSPRAYWERIKVGAGAPPLLTDLGWLLVYHGVGPMGRGELKHVRYSAGVALLDRHDPRRVKYRSPHPILSPGEFERRGVVPNVVFPTGLDCRGDIGQPKRVDMYFGMADDRIGVASLRVPMALSLAEDDRPFGLS